MPSRTNAAAAEVAASALTTTPVLPKDLHYVDCAKPGFTRKRVGRGFAYFDCKGERVRNEVVLDRIRQLAIPPAYQDVWICIDPRGHLQATGRDAKGRRQYRYHARWRETRDATKYDRLLAFGKTLGKIRRRVKRDMDLPGLPRDKVIATVVHLLDITLIRVGNTDYARDNHSYGLTTMRNKHVALHASDVRFQFRGKSGVAHDVTVHDPRVARIVRSCMDLPGHELFQYLDEHDARHVVDSNDINTYLGECSDANFTAKDYRTWAGSVLALDAFRHLLEREDTEHVATLRKKQSVEVVKEIARALGNTPAVCRRCYIHPKVLDTYLDGSMGDIVLKARAPRGVSMLHAPEKTFAAFVAALA